MTRLLTPIVIAGFSFALMGCEDLGLNINEPRANTQAPTQPTRILRGEVERPDIFNQEGAAIWDGRPALGGQWVASTQTRDLERVRVTNLENGEVIEAALFKIEPGTPGPGLILSSDAAQALEIVPGTPTQIKIVALREAERVQSAPIETEATSGSTTNADPTGAQSNDNADSATSNAPLNTAIPTPRGPSPEVARRNTAGTSALEEAVVEPAATQQTADPVLEIAAFKTEAEADTALSQLKVAGLNAQKTQKRGLLNTRWVIFAGPFDTPEELIAARKAATEAGFDEAFVRAR
ncbi:MAG: SPOR domain-containing protein [Pseudomonadota bacterium]